MSFNLNKIVKEWSYRVHDGMPDIKDPLHMVELQQLLHERKYPRKFIETLLNRLRESEASEKAKEMGLVHLGGTAYGREEDGATTHVSKEGELVPVGDVKAKKGTGEPEDKAAAKKAEKAATEKKIKKAKEKFHKQIYDDPKVAKEVLRNRDKYPEGSEERALAWDTHLYGQEVENAELVGREPISRESLRWKEGSKTAAANRAREVRIMTDPNISDDESARDLEALRQTGESYDLYNPLKGSLIANGYGVEVEVRDDITGEVVRMKSQDILKKFINEFQSITEKLSTEDKEKFAEYLKNPTLEFDPDNTGNLFEKAANSGVPPAILDAIMRHTTQDSGKKGVGMGEFAMSMIFKNIKNASSKGDLALIVKQPDGTTIEKPFELKGQEAVLGAKPETFKVSQRTRDDFGVTETDKGKFSIVIDGETKMYGKNQTNQLLADKWNSLKTDDERAEFKANFKRMIVNDGHGVGTKVSDADKPWEELDENGQDLYDAFMSDPDLGIDFSDPASIGNTIGLLNYAGYAISDEHTEFAAHDMGAADEKASKRHGINKGNYVRAGTDHPGGTRAAALDMAKQLKANCIGFERISFENVRPRVGLGTHTGNDGELSYTRPPGCG